MQLIELKNICKTYHLGEVDVPTLKNVSLTISRGEFVALMGASGSGKTTLMNLLGCLDRPSSGSYRFDGLEITNLGNSERSLLRSSRIGFVFQSFNLLARTSAVENVTMPAGYSALKRSTKELKTESHELLARMGLGSRLTHRPNQLSGGEQQRVAIARSLVNRPMMLLADEPTGNLDSRTSKETLKLFRRLNEEQKITLLMVTHDPEVARHADRVIRIQDGQIVDDPGAARQDKRTTSDPSGASQNPTDLLSARRGRGSLRIAAGAARTALQALRRNLMRTMLTMLGVIIGVAAVISVLEISQGASAAIQVTVSNMGANTLYVASDTTQQASERLGDLEETLSPDDCLAIQEECPAIVRAAPIVNATARVVYGNRDWTPIYLTGTTADYLQARNWQIELGRVFTEREIRSASKVCLIGQTLVEQLCGDEYPIGAEIRVNNVPLQVIGVLEEKGANLLGTDQDDTLLAPWTTIKYRISGSSSGQTPSRERLSGLPGVPLVERLPGSTLRARSETIPGILVQAASPQAVPQAVDQITRLLRDRHGLPDDERDFNIYDNAEVSNALKKTVGMMSGLGMSLAAVSLIVGGVGIMNIMLVSVTERTREIGLRMAIGADARDILRQFLVEAVVLCLVGGVIGICAGRGASLLVGSVMGWRTDASLAATIVAVAAAVIVGVTFGFYPAWKASRLNPIEALRYE